MKYISSCTSDGQWWPIYGKALSDQIPPMSEETAQMITKKLEEEELSRPCDEIEAVQNLLRNSKHLRNCVIVITKDKAAIL